MAEHHRDFQRILWRPNRNEELREYLLKTVTYGTISAPDMAERALQQCASDQQEHSPTGAEVMLNDFYVEDMLTGGD